MNETDLIKERIASLSDIELEMHLSLGEDAFIAGVFDFYYSEATRRGLIEPASNLKQSILGPDPKDSKSLEPLRIVAPSELNAQQIIRFVDAIMEARVKGEWGIVIDCSNLRTIQPDTFQSLDVLEIILKTRLQIAFAATNASVVATLQSYGFSQFYGRYDSVVHASEALKQNRLG
jgi:hypothetical protein